MGHFNLMRILTSLLFSLVASTGLATCPTNPSIGSDLNQAYHELKYIKFAADAQQVTDQLWRLWTQAPNEKAQRLLNNGMLKMRQGDLIASQTDFTKLIEYCPNYAEGYNQRAFALYLSSNFKDAMLDLKKALIIRPRHLGALSGAGLAYLALGQPAKAEIKFRKLISLNPFTPERDLMPNLGTDL